MYSYLAPNASSEDRFSEHTSQASPTSILLTRDLAAYTDPELDQYLAVNRGQISVEDPHTLKQDTALLQRLSRARAGPNDTVQSYPIDLDYLTARLRHDKDIGFAKRHQPRYDEAWRKLLGSRILKPLEVEEIICNIDSAFQRAGEEYRAEKAVTVARSAVKPGKRAIIDLRRFNLAQRESQQRLTATQSKLNAAMQSLQLAKRWNDLIDEFRKNTGKA
ncbi:uncharacterized protein BP5553_07707 [Venustampulla echinocandica]|uniref:Uncharacterized protein n=1 Tax=Venustampulla echinocandica TaxID=2656787 RepID=A0A370THA5_9HELO|nr:uncharacterized protein BP5553_07707 [Venustampulla echinocandica]RDL34579.1 hypothetical protein BP5553_07707 [Venustampulla echinocandica]